MKAIVQRVYGPPDVLALEEIEKPALDDDGVLLRVRASSVNKADAYRIRGVPWFVTAMMTRSFKSAPPDLVPGTDVAGIVEAVGKNVTRFHPGDEVFGARSGAYAEYVRITEKSAIAPKPANVTFEQAGAVGIAGCTALQGLRDVGHLKSGERVLINGATGGVGTFAVQIAKALGAHVTAVCKTSNVDLVRSIGADVVIDYLNEDFAKRADRYDLFFDVAGSRSLSTYTSVLAPGGSVVLAGARKGGFAGIIWRIVEARLRTRFGKTPIRFYVAKLKEADLAALGELMAAGKLAPVVDRTYPLRDTADAIRYLEAGHARGKVVITV
ncbi:MAG TPA: NAD(P)-dependent alcohol dehydrogenase [Candidatus Limnocylindria bacterium]|jgi:NADPH:quinone reductase-like Zn-dependent oxidoreductase